MHILKKLNIVPVPLADIQPQICRARALMEANKLGVFTALEESRNGLTHEEVAERVGISREGAAVLLTALDKTGYLRKREGCYTNGPWAKRWIVNPKRGIANVLKLQIHGWSRLGDLKSPLRTGRPIKDYHALEVSTHSERQEIYTLAMREMAHLLIPHFLKRVILPRGARRLLDIGGAHGDYCRSLVRKFPGLRATILDLAGPIATAQRILEKEGNPEGIELRVGDALKDDLGSGWDAVLLINMVHLFQFYQNRKLLLRIHESLSPHGVLILMDQFLGAGRLQDTIAGLVSLNYFTVGGKCYHLEEMKGLLKETGFRQIKVKPFLLGAPTVLFQGWK